MIVIISPKSEQGLYTFDQRKAQKLNILPGTKIYLKHTREWGVIKTSLADGYIEVNDAAGAFSIVHQDDILLEEEYYYEMHELNALEEKQKRENPSTKNPGDKKDFTPPTNDLYLLLTTEDQAPIAEEYQCWLINATPYLCTFEGKMVSLEGVLHNESGILDSGMQLMFCELFKEDLSAQVRLDIKLIFSVEDREVEQTLRCRFHPKKLLELKQKTKAEEWWIWMLLMESKDLIVPKPELKIPMIKSPKPNRSNLARVDIYDINKRAAFPLSIDLHADKLIPASKAKSKVEILKIQMDTFSKYINEAINLGVDNIFVIHGIGEGKLRQRIHDYLDQMDHISGYVNEYHPKYGYGATEIWIK